MSGKHAAPVIPKRYKTNVDGRMVDVPPPGKYMHPLTGHRYTLAGTFSWYSWGSGASSGWPVFWHELTPVDEVEDATANSLIRDFYTGTRDPA